MHFSSSSSFSSLTCLKLSPPFPCLEKKGNCSKWKYGFHFADAMGWLVVFLCVVVVALYTIFLYIRFFYFSMYHELVPSLVLVDVVDCVWKVVYVGAFFFFLPNDFPMRQISLKSAYDWAFVLCMSRRPSLILLSLDLTGFSWLIDTVRRWSHLHHKCIYWSNWLFGVILLHAHTSAFEG